MRPVNKQALSASSNSRTLKPSQVGNLLLAALGPYCSFCEARLDDPIGIQDKRSEKSAFGLNDWDYLLLICSFCKQSAERAYLDRENWMGRNLWPDTDTTFTLVGHGPFQYVLQTVNVVSVSPLDESTTLPSEHQVIIKAGAVATGRAQATIDLFALNSIYYDDASNTMLIPSANYNQIEDLRVKRRTAVWQAAASAAARLRGRSSDSPIYDLLCEQITTTAKYGGFWSTWMTVFWNSFGDGDLLTRLFIETPKMGDFVFTGRAEDFTSGPFSYLPGTDKSRILGRAQSGPRAGG